jgi:shikimate 5-dehydrogenase
MSLALISRRIGASADIETNNRGSEALRKSIPKATRFYDLIYHTEETVFLRHDRMTEHQTMYGKHMIIRQAVMAVIIAPVPQVKRQPQSRILDAAISRQVTNSKSAVLPSSTTFLARCSAPTI